MGDNQLNDDILGVIAGLLSSETLAAAASVHRVFNERYMRFRYEKLSISASDKQTKRLLSHIRDTPTIIPLVRGVHIKPWRVRPCTQSYQSRTENALNHIAAVFDPHYTKKQAEYRLQKRLSKDIQRVQSTLFALTHVDSYTVEWDSGEEYHPELLAAFIVPVLQCWQSRLRSLTVRLPLHLYGTLAQVKLPNLECIEIHLNTGQLDPASINIHMDAWLVFLHNLKDTLRSLTIQSTPSSEGLDLSRLFRHMGTFPHLRSFSLTIPFDGGHLSTCRPFSRFLTKHSETLECLALKTTRCSTHSKPIEPDCQNWIQSTISSVNAPMPRLESVAIALRPLKAPLDPLGNFLRLHAGSLRKLALTDRTLTLEEVQDYVMAPLAIPSGHADSGFIALKHLEVRVQLLRPCLLRVLATGIPELHTLKLTFGGCRDPTLFRSALRCSGFDISKWALKRFIMPPGPNASWIRSLECVLVECIPAIESIEELAECD